MRKILLPLALLLLLQFTHVFAQKMPEDYFEEADKYCEDKDYKNALASFQYIVNNHPKNDLYPRSYYNVGYIYFVIEQYDSAIVIFKSIISGTFNEKEDLGGDIMADPYTNYRHRACGILSEIYKEKKDYDSALYYFSLADTVHPYLHFCGNEYASNDIYTALGYADLYKKMGKTDKAIESLLPAVFITLANNSKVIEELKTLLKKKKNLKSKLDAALNNIYAKTIHREDYSYVRYYFNFLNAEIPALDGYESEKKKFDKSSTIKEIKETNFYKMVIAL